MPRLYTAKEAAAIIADDISEEDFNGGDGYQSDDEEIPTVVEEVDDPSDNGSTSSDESIEEPNVGASITYRAVDGTQWTSEPPRPASYRASNNVRINPGPTNLTKYLREPEEFFHYFLRETTMNSIALNTNIRLAELVNDADREHENTNRDVSGDEIYSYCGTLLLLGVLKKRDVDTSELFKDGEDNIHRVHHVVTTFSRERFRMLSRYLTFDNPENRQERGKTQGKFFKIADVFSSFSSQVRLAYEPGTHLCIDECLYPFRGRCSFIQYMPQKPAKYGLKFWVMSDCESKIIINIMPYVGKEGGVVQVGLAHNVVLQLSAPFADEWRNITTDNYYTSVSLANELWENKYTLLGTLKKNSKGIPVDAKQLSEREPNTSKFYFNGKQSVVSYCPKRKKVVMLLSTQHHDKGIDADTHEKQKPKMITCYNSTKGTVDRNDQSFAHFSVRRRTCRWTMRTFHFIVDAAALNSYHLFIEVHDNEYIKQRLGSQKTQWRRAFLEILAKQLMAREMSRRHQAFVETRWLGCQKNLRTSYGICGFNIGPVAAIAMRNPQTRRRCSLCGRDKDRKVATFCSECFEATCAEHGRFVCNRH